MIGKRIYLNKDGDFILSEPGQYGKDKDGRWLTSLPIEGELIAGNLASHEVVEHEDGSITVSPSILVHWGPGMSKEWHGYLERGIWREV